MEPYIVAIISSVASLAGLAAGWAMARESERRRNRSLARQMVESVRATKSRTRPEDMMSYENRQRTLANQDNPTRARQGSVRFRTKAVRRRK